MTIGVSGRRDVREVTEIAKHEIQEVLPQVTGVGRVFLSGGRTRAINIVLDTRRLIAYGLSVENVRQALAGRGDVCGAEQRSLGVGARSALRNL